MAAVGGVTVCPTVGSAAVVGAVDVLGLHCCNQGGQLCLSGVGRGLDACHSQRVFRWRWKAAAGAKGVVAITAVAFPAWYPAWLEVMSREEWSCSASVKSSEPLEANWLPRVS